MKAGIISIGNELLSGFTINTNGAFIGQSLLNIGIEVIENIVIGDNKITINSTLNKYIKYYDLIILTGGLGPTHDDVTSEVLYDYFKDVPKFDSNYWEKIVKYYKNRNIALPATIKTQALKSTKGIMIPNDFGSARGICYKKNNSKIYALPGVPSEMKAMMKKYIIPQLSDFSKQDIYFLTFRTIGIGESVIAENIKIIMDKYAKYCVFSFLPQVYGVDIRIKSNNRKKIENCALDIENNLGIVIYGKNDDSLEKVIGNMLKNKNYTISVAESCTAGLLGHIITSCSGSSEYFLGGAICYNNKIKRDTLGIKKTTLAKFGAVSKEIALEMAIGIRNKYNSDIGLSITGIAGPTGGTKYKPIGLVYLGYSSSKKNHFEKHKFYGDRNKIKYMSSLSAINLLRRELIYG